MSYRPVPAAPSVSTDHTDELRADVQAKATEVLSKHFHGGHWIKYPTADEIVAAEALLRSGQIISSIAPGESIAIRLGPRKGTSE